MEIFKYAITYQSHFFSNLAIQSIRFDLFFNFSLEGMPSAKGIPSEGVTSIFYNYGKT